MRRVLPNDRTVAVSPLPAAVEPVSGGTPSAVPVIATGATAEVATSRSRCGPAASGTASSPHGTASTGWPDSAAATGTLARSGTARPSTESASPAPQPIENDRPTAGSATPSGRTSLMPTGNVCTAWLIESSEDRSVRRAR